MTKRYAIRTIAAPAQYLKDGRYAGWSDSPGDARVFNRKSDAANCPKFNRNKHEIIGVVIVTQSEWDLLQEALPQENQEVVLKAYLKAIEDAAEHLAYLEGAGVDNWSEYRSLEGFRDDDDALAVYA